MGGGQYIIEASASGRRAHSRPWSVVYCGVSSRLIRVDRVMRLMTYNLNFANPDVAASLVAIAAADADLVLLQEVSPDWRYERLPPGSSVPRIDASRISIGWAVRTSWPRSRSSIWICSVQPGLALISSSGAAASTLSALR